MDALTTWGRVSCTTRWPPFPVDYVSWFPSELQGKSSAIDRVTILKSSIVQVVGAR